MPPPYSKSRADPPRERILDAFVEMLLEGPYDDFTVTQLLQRAAVGRATFYSHFAGKEALLEASVGRLGAALAAQARGSKLPMGFLSPFMHHVASHGAVYQAFVGRPGFEVLERALRRMLADLVRQGQPGKADEVAVQFAVGAIWSVMRAWIERRLSGGADELVTRVLQLLQCGVVGVPPTAAGPAPNSGR